jgi:glutathione S-transferase
MMKLFHTPASHFVRKCMVTIKELGLQDRVEMAAFLGHRNDAVPAGFP